MAYEDDYSEDQPMTPGMRLLRGRGGSAVADEDQAGPSGEPNTGATPNTQEPHEQMQESAAQDDSATQSAPRPSAGQRFLGVSNPAAGISAHNNDGSPADVVPTGTDSKGRPTLGVTPALSVPRTQPDISSLTPAAGSGPKVSTIGQRLMNMRQPPAAPKMNPEQSAVQQDLREHSQVTPKTDPTTGKTLPQYKMGFGGRLLGSLVNFGNGAARNGAEVIHVGPGATNRRYSVDETNRQQRVAADQEKIKSMNDEFSQAEKGYGHELTSYNDEAKAAGRQDINDINQQRDAERVRHDKETEDLRSQVNELKDPQSQASARAKLADQNGLVGKQRASYVLTGKLPDEETIAEKLRQSEEKIGIMRDKLELDRDKAAHQQQKGKDRALLLKGIEKDKEDELSKAQNQFNKDFAKAQADKDTDRQDELTRELNDNKTRIQKSYEDKIRTIPEEREKQDAKPVQKSAPAAAPAGNQDIEQPIAPVRTGAPATQPTQGTKSISKADVQKLADSHKMTYEKAAAQFIGKGYTIN